MTGDNFAKMFSQMDDEYMKARAADVKDISERLVSVLLGNGTDMGALKEPVILVADALALSETVQLDKSKILAFVTRYGSSNAYHHSGGADGHCLVLLQRLGYVEKQASRQHLDL